MQTIVALTSPERRKPFEDTNIKTKILVELGMELIEHVLGLGSIPRHVSTHMGTHTGNLTITFSVK